MHSNSFLFLRVNYKCSKIISVDSMLIATKQKLESHNLLETFIEVLLAPSHYIISAKMLFIISERDCLYIESQ